MDNLAGNETNRYRMVPEAWATIDRDPVHSFRCTVERSAFATIKRELRKDSYVNRHDSMYNIIRGNRCAALISGLSTKG